MPKISVIIPVYNTEKYLERCINSVVNQTLINIEIIVLNDGSLDNSEQIILKYCELDKRIKYYKHQNMGLGPTRNRGIELALGEYLAFIDSDDLIEIDMLEKLYKNAKENNADIVCCEVYLFSDGKEKQIRKKFGNTEIISFSINTDYEDFYKDYYFARIFSHNAWDKIYRTNIVRENSIKFGDNKRIFAEDNYFQIQILQFAKIISFLNEPLYNYYQRDGSIMNTYKKNIIQRHLTMINELNDMESISNNGLITQKVLALIAFDSLIIEAINITENKRSLHELINSINLFKKHLFFPKYIDLMIYKKAPLLEPNRSKQYVMFFTSYLLKYGYCNLVSLLLYLKYSFLR